MAPYRNASDPLSALQDAQDLFSKLDDQTNLDVLTGFIETVQRASHLSRGDLKILHRAVRELRYAMSVFADYRHIRKVSVFGSARTTPGTPTYEMAFRFAQRITEHDFMVIAGAGIMRAAHEGAGRERSFGLNILLPFEQATNEIMQNDPKLVYLKYFFTRKLMFVKETDAFALFPGGFGTHDEAFEALTLLQTGKSDLTPLVFVDVPGSTYWSDWYHFVRTHLLDRELITPSDLHLFKVTDDLDEAVDEIRGFYRNYHSLRYVKGKLVLRLQRRPSQRLLNHLNKSFSDIVSSGKIATCEAEGDDATEFPHLPRLSFWFNRVHYGRLRQLIDALNQH